MFNILITVKLLQVAVSSCTSTSNTRVSVVPYPCQHFVLLVFSMLTIQGDVQWHLTTSVSLTSCYLLFICPFFGSLSPVSAFFWIYWYYYLWYNSIYLKSLLIKSNGLQLQRLYSVRRNSVYFMIHHLKMDLRSWLYRINLKKSGQSLHERKGKDQWSGGEESTNVKTELLKMQLLVFKAITVLKLSPFKKTI